MPRFFGRNRHGKEVQFTMRTWDFAGQEEFYSTHQCFLSNRAIYLVCKIAIARQEEEQDNVTA